MMKTEKLKNRVPDAVVDGDAQVSGTGNLSCPGCGSGRRRRDGVVDQVQADGSVVPVQRWICKGCGRSYLASYRQAPVSSIKRRIAARLLALDVAPLVVAMALGVSDAWVYGYRQELYKLHGDDLVGILPGGGGVNG